MVRLISGTEPGIIITATKRDIMNKYAVTIDVETEYSPEVILKNVRDALEQYYKHTHNGWIKGWRIERTGTVEPEPEPVDVRGLLLWEIMNGWYWEVANVANRCAKKVINKRGQALDDDDLFEVSAEIWADQRAGVLPAFHYAGIQETVKTAYEALLTVNGDRPDDLQEQFPSWVDEGFEPVGDLEETARLFEVATGPMPARRYEFKKGS